jgi:hypothetical protein
MADGQEASSAARGDSAADTRFPTRTTDATRIDQSTGEADYGLARGSLVASEPAIDALRVDREADNASGARSLQAPPIARDIADAPGATRPVQSGSHELYWTQDPAIPEESGTPAPAAEAVRRGD